MTTQTTDERRAKVLEDYRNEFETNSGLKFFANKARGNRSRFGYQPPVNRRDYGHAIKTLGEMAAESDELAQIASAIVGRINPYGTDSEEAAKVYEAAASAIREGYTDVIGRAAPDAGGRRSSYERAYSTREVVSVLLWLDAVTAPFCRGGGAGIGWCLEQVATDLNMQLTLTRTKAITEKVLYPLGKPERRYS